MAVFKDKWNGYEGDTWRVSVSYKDWKGERCKHEKRGFKTKREALAYEHEYAAKMSKDINMNFGSFLDIYLKDLKPQLKESTYVTKVYIVDHHIRPYFKNKTLSGICSTDILQWQNELLVKRDEYGRGYAPTYLRTIHNQLNAAFNHAVRYYDLPKNPSRANKTLGKSKGKEMLFWTEEEFQRFINAVMDKDISYYAFQLLFWTGIRCGELLALTAEDFDFEKQTLTINKTYQHVNGKNIITSPKTEKSNRVIDLPKFLCDEMENYFSSIYKLKKDARLFEVSKGYLHHELDRGCRISGVKRIRLHDLRHSSVALLINLGYSTIQIADRMGHENAAITERYAHLYPTAQKEMACKMDQLHKSMVEQEDGDE